MVMVMVYDVSRLRMVMLRGRGVLLLLFGRGRPMLRLLGGGMMLRYG